MEALEKDGAFAEVVRGIVTGKWNNRDIKNSVTTTATGVLIPEVISAKVIDIARDKSLFGAVEYQQFQCQQIICQFQELKRPCFRI